MTAISLVYPSLLGHLEGVPQPQLQDLLTMVINHLVNVMILQVAVNIKNKNLSDLPNGIVSNIQLIELSPPTRVGCSLMKYFNKALGETEKPMFFLNDSWRNSVISLKIIYIYMYVHRFQILVSIFQAIGYLAYNPTVSPAVKLFPRPHTTDRFPPKGSSFWKGNPIISGKARLVKYDNLARYIHLDTIYTL